MKKEDLKQLTIPALYIASILAFIGSIYFLNQSFNNNGFIGNDNFIYVSNSIFDNIIPVNNTGETEAIIKPFVVDGVNIIKNYYDYKSDIGLQQNSLIYYENTYMQNSGVDYSSNTEFDVVSILSGTVINVFEDNLLGYVVEIRHNNDLISYYQSLKDVTVEKDNEVAQGQIIGKSGKSNIFKDLDNHLHFELSHKGQIVNPEAYYDKPLKELIE